MSLDKNLRAAIERRRGDVHPALAALIALGLFYKDIAAMLDVPAAHVSAWANGADVAEEVAPQLIYQACRAVGTVERTLGEIVTRDPAAAFARGYRAYVRTVHEVRTSLSRAGYLRRHADAEA